MSMITLPIALATVAVATVAAIASRGGDVSQLDMLHADAAQLRLTLLATPELDPGLLPQGDSKIPRSRLLPLTEAAAPTLQQYGVPSSMLADNRNLWRDFAGSVSLRESREWRLVDWCGYRQVVHGESCSSVPVSWTRVYYLMTVATQTASARLAKACTRLNAAGTKCDHGTLPGDPALRYFSVGVRLP